MSSSAPDVSLTFSSDGTERYDALIAGYNLICNKIVYWLMQKSVNGMYDPLVYDDGKCHQIFHIVADVKQGAIIIRPSVPILTDEREDIYSVVIFWTRETNLSYADLSASTKRTLLDSIVRYIVLNIGKGVVRSPHRAVSQRTSLRQRLFSIRKIGVVDFFCDFDTLNSLRLVSWKDLVLGDTLTQIKKQTIEEMLTGSDGYLRQVAQAIQAKA